MGSTDCAKTGASGFNEKAKPMANIASLLKTEIIRIARKEIRAEIESLKKANSQHRSLIVQLKREVAALQKQLRQVNRERVAAANETKISDRKHRFSATRLAAHREKLGLSAADYGKLVGVSGNTVYLWERGKSRPKPEQVQQLGMIKRLSRKAALGQLEQIKGSTASASG
jgi:DNA-binding transcriptional regulator YiaG